MVPAEKYAGNPVVTRGDDDLGLVISNDGIHFREPVRNFAFLSRGDDGEWDQRGLLQAQAFVNVGVQTCIWYGAWVPGSYEPRGGVGLATLGAGPLRFPSRWGPLPKPPRS